VTPTIAETGTVFGSKYRLIRQIGVGGMGVVFEAENVLTQRHVAVKVLHWQYAQTHEAIERFWQEARAASKMAHPNIVAVLDADLDTNYDVPYIVQELLEGSSLREHLDAQTSGRLSVGESLAILVPIMEALAVAHREGIVHRDLKPGNVFLARDPSGKVIPRLIDFGVSKLVTDEHAFHTETGAIVGTPAYMSPEQARCEHDIDGRADIWAIAALLYQLVTGKLPFEAPNQHMLMAQILYEIPIAIDAPSRGISLPDGFAAVVMRALERERSVRYADMEAFRDALLSLECAATIPEDITLESATRSSIRPVRMARPIRSRPPPARTTEVPAPIAASSGFNSRIKIGPTGLILALGTAAIFGNLVSRETSHKTPMARESVATRPTYNIPHVEATHAILATDASQHSIDATDVDASTDVSLIAANGHLQDTVRSTRRPSANRNTSRPQPAGVRRVSPHEPTRLVRPRVQTQTTASDPLAPDPSLFRSGRSRRSP
jgi:serine/threonine protein kinase